MNMLVVWLWTAAVLCMLLMGIISTWRAERKELLKKNADLAETVSVMRGTNNTLRATNEAQQRTIDILMSLIRAKNQEAEK